MMVNVLSKEKFDVFQVGIRSYEVEAIVIYEDARRAVLFIPPAEFMDVYETAPEMEFHHKFVQSLLTWVWYEVHKNEVPLENLPEPLSAFSYDTKNPSQPTGCDFTIRL